MMPVLLEIAEMFIRYYHYLNTIDKYVLHSL